MSISFNRTNDNVIITLPSDGVQIHLKANDSRVNQYMPLVISGEEDELRDLHFGVEEDEVEDKVVGKGNLDFNDVRLVDGVVYFKDDVVDEVLSDKINGLVVDGLPSIGWFHFVERLYKNSSSSVIKQVCNFIDLCGLTVDTEGYIIGYKAVRYDFMDKYTGTISNRVGAIVKMDRNKVDDDPKAACGRGLHFGGLNYIAWYGGGNDRIVVVRVDPANVVCVPNDSYHKTSKVRCCEYKVIGEYNGPLREAQYDAELTVDEMYDQDQQCGPDTADEFDWKSIDDQYNDGDISVTYDEEEDYEYPECDDECVVECCDDEDCDEESLAKIEGEMTNLLGRWFTSFVNNNQ